MGTRINEKIEPIKLGYELRDHANHPIKIAYELGEISGKLSIAPQVKRKEGTLVFYWKEREISLEIRIHYEFTDNSKKAYNFDRFLDDLQELIEKVIDFDESGTNQSKINHFINPHLSGVYRDLDRLSNPVEVSYELDQDRIKFHGISTQNLYEYAWNNKRDENAKLGFPVLINGIEKEVFWSEKKKSWILDEFERNPVPRTGKSLIGISKSPDHDINKRHNFNKLERMKYSLNDLKNSANYPGNKVLKNIFSSKNQLRNFSPTNLSQTLDNFDLVDDFDNLDSEQRKCVREFFKQYALVIDGEGGTGKTEVGALAAIIAALQGKKVFISSETNNAIDNFLSRIHGKVVKSKLAHQKLNIVRYRSRFQDVKSTDIEDYELESVIRGLQQGIKQAYSSSVGAGKDSALKREFNELFTKPRILERIIALTYDIILGTYGIISEQRYFHDPLQVFDTNIIDACSSVNFSSFSLSARKSRSWILLNDERQLSPLTIGDFLLKQPLRFPDENEIKKAVKYDPGGEKFKNACTIVGAKEYRESVASYFKRNTRIKSITLKNQYRIHPDLYVQICAAFDKQPESKKSNSSHFLDLGTISPLLSTKKRLNYHMMKGEEIPLKMGFKVAELIKDLEKNLDESHRKVSVGIAC
ncbi:MAG: AAA domain-containing protein, partial [Candidatus Helarchaeales archaeon]